jgi:cysteine synthase
MFSQLRREPHPVPVWVVVGAGTGGTSATIGRYLRLHKLATRLCVVDPEGSAFWPSWSSGDPHVTAPGSRIEGIGRPRDAGITATNGSPSRPAKYASLTAVEPDDASTSVVPWPIHPLHRPYRTSERADRCFRLPVGWTDSSLR